MSQTVRYWTGGIEILRELPNAHDTVIPGVHWGDHWVLFTPAYWLSQLWMNALQLQKRAPYQAHGTLEEEIVFCMLGGFGITAELASAAFVACRNVGLISRREVCVNDWIDVLREPLKVCGRHMRYRYPHQKATYLAGAMKHIADHPISADRGSELRDQLLNIKGVGPKTAGWIARNYLDADDVAILDIHIVRAGLLCDLFSPNQRVERDYLSMEARFIEFCRSIRARPAVLDCLIWDQMRSYGEVALQALNGKLHADKAARLPVGTRHKRVAV